MSTFSDMYNSAAESDVDQPLEEFSDSEGQVEEIGEDAVEAEVSDENLDDFFNYTEYADKKIRIKVDGEEVEVPLSEALAGYQRQSDYTRKTQELSKQRAELQTAQAIQEALATNPEETIRLLQQHYGKPAAAPKQQGFYPTVQEEDLWEDPVMKELDELKRWKQELEFKETVTSIEKELQSLEVKYGEDFNRDEVIAKALETNSTDLEATFKLIQFDRVYTESKNANKKLAETTQRTQAKKSAQVVSGSSSARGGQPIATSSPKTVTEAFSEAAKQLGL